MNTFKRFATAFVCAASLTSSVVAASISENCMNGWNKGLNKVVRIQKVRNFLTLTGNEGALERAKDAGRIGAVVVPTAAVLGLAGFLVYKFAPKAFKFVRAKFA